LERLLFTKIYVWVALLAFLTLSTVGGLWLYAMVSYHVFPYTQLRAIKQFIQGDKFEDATLGDRIQALWRPRNRFEINPELDANAAFGQISLETTLSQGYYLIYGIFLWQESPVPSALLIDVQGDVRRSWQFPLQGTSNAVRRLALSNDGILVSNSSGLLRSIDWCGKEIWTQSVAGGTGYHHEIDLHDGRATLWRNDSIVDVDLATGEYDEVVSIRRIVLANPDEALLRTVLADSARATFRYGDDNSGLIFSKNEQGVKGDIRIHSEDAFHPNSAVVNRGRSSAFPDEAYLISLRQPSMVAIIEPTSGRILWSETFDRQHDPDWHEDGISVYNNRTHFSDSLIEYQPFDGPRETLVGPGQHEWYRAVTGNHQIMADDSIVFQGAEGEMVHVASDGTVMTLIKSRFELRNGYFLTGSQVAAFEEGCKAHSGSG
jgi:hypothetical protein